MKKILIISDNLLFLNKFSIFDAFNNTGYVIEKTGCIETANYWLTKPEEYVLIIIDIEMSPWRLFSLEETQNGHITGIVWCEKELLSLHIPVLFWSDWEDHPVLVKDFILKYPENKIGFLWRVNLKKNHLFEGVNKFLEN